ncbi:hypothetical protein AB0H60_31220 [Nocardia rhamnosiphila]|uniref:hypothetical protein n=1 Tax=Nocardia rhamnosiphila TaxID=426716 RepID=UPI0033F0A156
MVAWDSVPQAAVGPDPQALAVVGDPRDFDERMSRWVTDYLHGGKETTLWGDNAWPGPHPHTEPVRFCPSRTALLFKAHALDRTGRSPSAVPGIEYFRVTGAAVSG